MVRRSMVPIGGHGIDGGSGSGSGGGGAVWRSGAVVVVVVRCGEWRCGGVEACGCVGVAAWQLGHVAVRRCGGVAVWGCVSVAVWRW